MRKHNKPDCILTRKAFYMDNKNRNWLHHPVTQPIGTEAVHLKIIQHVRRQEHTTCPLPTVSPAFVSPNNYAPIPAPEGISDLNPHTYQPVEHEHNEEPYDERK